MPTVEPRDEFSSLDDGRTVVERIFKNFQALAAITRGISDGRMAVLVHHQCPYPKTLALLGCLAPHNPAGVRELQAHFNAWIEALLLPFEATAQGTARLHKECFDAVHAKLEGKTIDEREREVLEAIAQLNCEWACLQVEKLRATGTSQGVM